MAIIYSFNYIASTLNLNYFIALNHGSLFTSTMFCKLGIIKPSNLHNGKMQFSNSLTKIGDINMTGKQELYLCTSLQTYIRITI